MFNPIVDMALVNKVMGLGSTPNTTPNDTPQVSNRKKSKKGNDTNEVPITPVGFNPANPWMMKEFSKDARTYGIHQDKNGNYVVYKYGSYRRSVIIIGIIIIFLQLCILGNL